MKSGMALENVGEKDNKIKEKEMPDDQRDSTAANNAGPNNQGNIHTHRQPASMTRMNVIRKIIKRQLLISFIRIIPT